MAKSSIGDINEVFDLLNRDIWVVTAGCVNDRGGLVATFVMRSSIDSEEPMVLIGLGRNHHTAELVNRFGTFCLHLLSEEQLDYAWRFCLASGRSADKFAGLTTMVSPTGSPLLRECLAWLDCRVIARYDAGDRWYYWADVVGGKRLRDGTPLREQDLLAAASPDQKSALQADRFADQVLQRPLREQWRRGLGG